VRIPILNNNDQEPWIKVLQANVEQAVMGFPYIVKFKNYQTVEMMNECNQWLGMQDVPCITDNNNGKLYRFANLEDATLFKLSFGGDFIE
jgi:hypothetical protein